MATAPAVTRELHRYTTGGLQLYTTPGKFTFVHHTGNYPLLPVACYNCTPQSRTHRHEAERASQSISRRYARRLHQQAQMMKSFGQ